MDYHVMDLKRFCQQIFERLGVNSEDAALAADALIRANLEGTDSHGISRLAIYAKRMREGRINSKPLITCHKKGESVLLVNGDNGLGQIVSAHAIQKGIELAKETGVAAIAVRNSNHFGTAAYFCQLACEAGVAAMVLTNSPSGIPPWGGTKAFFGTNPIAFGFPTGTSTPVIIDMSTSVVARGKIILAAKQGQPIPNGWAINEQGDDTQDPSEALKGAVLPIGGAKGYTLALAVEIFTGILSGAAFGPHVQNIYNEKDQHANVGHFFLLFDIEKFMPLTQFYAVMSLFLEEMKSVPKTKEVKEILYPGERRAREYRTKIETGIALSSQVEDELITLGESLKVEFPRHKVL